MADVLLVRPPAHVADPERLVEVNGAANYVLYREVARRSRALNVAAVSSRTLTVGRDEAAHPVKVQCVTAAYFDILGGTPVAGRAFLPEEDARGAEPVTVLAYRLWKRDFGGRPDAIGATATIADRAHRIVGVAPRDFRGLGFERVDAWLLLTAVPDLCSGLGRDLLDDRSSAWLTTFGRLRPGVPWADAERDVRSLSLHEIRRAGSQPLSRELRPAISGGASARDELLAICLAAGAVLMLVIGCANVAGLLSVRALERRREIAMRVQLGASRARVFLLLSAENLMLTGASVFAAWGVARLLTSTLGAFFPQLARDAWFDPRGLIALAAFTLGAGVVAGTVSALQAVRAQVGGLWRVGHDVGGARAPWRSALIVSQVALALVLVASAGLFARSLVLVKSDLGYDLERVVIAPLDLEQAGVWQAPEIQRAFDEILVRVRALPGVEAASLTARTPNTTGQTITVMPKAVDAPKNSLAQMAHDISSDYFRTLGTRIVDGRPFTPEDGLGAPAVMIVDANLARELWPGEAVVGRCKSLNPSNSSWPCATVVGISQPRRFGSVTKRDGEVFRPLTQRPGSLPQAVLVRATVDADDIVPAVAAVIRSVVPSLAFADVRPFADLVDEGARSWRLGATLFGLFGGLAVALAALGLYASLALAVRQRTPEIGVRMALGADPGSVARLVLGQGIRLVAFGWLMGTAVAMVAADWIRSLLFGVQPNDPLTFTLASLVIVLAGLAGAGLPALRAAKLDPVKALRTY
ncbi:MAG: ABC transporter permease [Acidobacteriota bacterium]|nr:ABC transporter permease [Acidobacteriota bacterium]